MQPGVRVFPVHSRSLIYIYMERERLNFVVKAVGICEQCILWGEQNFIFWGIASLWSEFLLNFSNFEEIELSKYTWKKAHRIMVRLPSPKENGWSKLPSKSNFCACWPACVCYTISVMSSSLRPYGLWPTRLLCLWDSPGKNTGVCCHALQGSFRPRIETRSLSSRILTRGFFATSAMWEEPKRKCILVAAATLYIIYCYPDYLTSKQSASCEMPDWMKHKLELRLLGEISITSEMQMTIPCRKS